MVDDLGYDLDMMKPDELMLPPDMDPEEDSTRYPYVQFIQPQSTLRGGYPKGRGAGYIGVGRNEEGADGVSSWNGILLNSGEAIFMVIDHLTSVPDPESKYRGKAQRVGGRGFFPFLRDTGRPDPDAKNADGTKAGIVCKSVDGLVPLSSYLNKVIELPLNHPNSPGAAVIGLKNILTQGRPPTPEDLELARPDMVCLDCPLSKWYEKTTSPKGKKEWDRICKAKWAFVIYFPPQKALVLTEKAKKVGDKDVMREIDWEGGTAILQGHSQSVQSALEGDINGGKTQTTIDNVKIPGFFSFITPTGTKDLIVPKGELHPSVLTKVQAFGKDEANMLTIIEEERAAETAAAMADPDVKFALVRVNSLPYAQNGHPQLVGNTVGMPGMRYLQIDVVQSSWNNNPLVPFLRVSERDFDERDYDLWIDAIRAYKGEGMRDQLLLSENRATVAERLPKLLESNDNPLLGSGEVVEAELDDM